MSSASGTQPSSPANTSEERLDSWKDVAAYLKRSVPTVQRWEREEQLPVHRLQHKKQGTIYAYKGELDEWWRQRRAALERPEVEVGESSISGSSPNNRQRVWVTIAAAALILVLAVALASSFLRRDNHRAASPSRVMLAVLPFQNLGGGPELDYECDGLTEDLITELAIINPGRIGVIARTSAMTYKGRVKTVREVGDELAVQYVVEGSVRFAPEHARITAQLIRVSDQSHLWARSFEGTPGEMFKLEEEIAQSIAGEVDVRVNPATAKPRNQPNAQAYRLYVQGRQLWSTRSRPDLERSIELYQEALKYDPGYARAYAGLADSFNLLGYFGYRPLGYTVPEAQRAAQRALELDANLAEAHAAVGFINAMWIWDWKEAENHFQRAIQLDPSYVPAHHYYALFLASGGNLKRAEEEMTVARRLDPLSASVNGGYAYVLFFDRQYEQSLEYCQRALASEPGYAVAYAVRGWDLVQLGRYDDALSALEKARELAPENSLYLATLARVYILAGRKAQAERTVSELEELSKRQWVGGSMRAIVYAARGDTDQAFHWLGAAAKQEDGFLLWAKVTPEFDPLRQDARFGTLVERLKLP